jgi:ubiquinone/menaquinone biosynthesis C-methylase UbiE
MHMPNTEGAIKEIHRVLLPGGRVLAYMYNKSSWPFWFNLILLRGILQGKLITYRFNIDQLTSRYSDGFSVGGNMLAKFYTPAQAAQMFKNAGFSKVEAFPFELPEEPNHWPMALFPVFKYLPKTIKHRLSRFGYGLIVMAEK